MPRAYHTVAQDPYVPGQYNLLNNPHSLEIFIARKFRQEVVTARIRPASTQCGSQELRRLLLQAQPGGCQAGAGEDVLHPPDVAIALLRALLVDADGVDPKVSLVSLGLQVRQSRECIIQVVPYLEDLSVDDDFVGRLINSPHVREGNISWTFRDMKCRQRVLQAVADLGQYPEEADLRLGFVEGRVFKGSWGHFEMVTSTEYCL